MSVTNATGAAGDGRGTPGAAETQVADGEAPSGGVQGTALTVEPLADPTTVIAAADDTALRRGIDVALSQPTVVAAFQATWRAGGDRPALRRHGSDEVVTWAQYGARVRAIAGGLAAIGVGRDDAVAFLAGNVPDFNVADTAALHVGAVPYSLYATEPLDAMVGLVADAGARVIVAEGRFVARALEVAARVPAVTTVVALDDGADPSGTAPAGGTTPEGGSTTAGAPTTAGTTAAGTTTAGTTTAGGAGDAGAPEPSTPFAAELLDLDALVARTDPAFDFEASWRAVGAEDVATLVYTSGTTGAPKGVQLSHRAIMGPLRGVDVMAPASPGGRGVSFLPAAHITDRWVCHYGTIGFGGTLTCVPDPDGLFDAIAETRPTRFFGVPRTWEKLGDRARALIAGDPEREAALEAGYARVAAEQAAGGADDGATGGAGDRAADGGGADGDAADRSAAGTAPSDALAPVREALGLADAEWLAVAAAPSSVAMLELVHALGLQLAELWGMSEFIMALMNPPERIRLGAVGVPIPGVEARLADDGELLLRGPNACSGYRNDPVRTAELAQGDGWVASGDVAAVDDDGYFRIVGRKKELMINSSGKNLFPAKIEGAVSDASPLVGYVASIGDRRRFVTALIVLDADELRAFAAREGLEGGHADLAAHPAVLAEVERAVAAGNDHLARVEQVRGFTVLADVWTPGDAVVTNTMKLRRRVIAERYAEVIEALYPA
ncbi:AMP-binding protein [Patulibacter sp. NPDC049589]|uniref:AMP-dependent synthetase/ligase n=1 Tax=Patulibacter sp. NPDC049589 TaxID=3154731 RepID=UPI00343DA318